MTRSAAKSPIGTLARGLHVVSCIAAAGTSVGLTELAQAARLDKTTTYRLSTKLVELGYLEQDADGRFRLGLHILDLGFAYLASLDIRERALPEMRRLREELDGTISLCLLDGADIVYVERFAPKRLQASLPVGVGARLPAYCTAMGKALLAELSAAERDRLLRGAKLKKFTPQTVTDRAALLHELDESRARGFAISDNEMVVGLRAAGAAIKDRDGAPIAALSVAISADRITAAELVREIGPRVRKAALLIGSRTPSGMAVTA
ncbi:MAG TPA: IclR family transcriptional regulator [Candidatus Binatia bacterium]|nr:IclR family transcriptional regulator [Candidatus Binatia bacterium]